MSESNRRIRDYGTVHHLRSRIAHRVFFLQDEERNDLIEMIRRTALFSGLDMLGWCIMTNHFHVLVHLPHPIELDESELLRRYGILKGESARANAEKQLQTWRSSACEKLAEEWLDGLRRRMYDVGEFMKIVKQWFTEEYNRRQSHCGTLWESVYRDHVILLRKDDMSRVLGYIHLNPIRAAVSDKYDGYLWSSFSALARGDEMALAGIRFVYDDATASAAELIDRHTVLMDDLLEGIKRRRAEEIARKRAAGYEMPTDPLTTEAQIAQAVAHLAEVQKAMVDIRSSRELESATRMKIDKSAEQLLSALTADPMADVAALANTLSFSKSNVYKLLAYLKSKGTISRQSRTTPWLINC